MTLGHILTGDVEDRFAQREQAEKQLRKFIRDETLAAFPVVVVEADLSEAIKALLQCHGIGGVRPNTVLLGWSQDPARQDTFCETLRISQRFQRSILIVKCDEEKERWASADRIRGYLVARARARGARPFTGPSAGSES